MFGKRSTDGVKKHEQETNKAANFWLDELDAQQHTWDQSAEINYTKLAQLQQERAIDHNTPDLFEYSSTSTFIVKQLGVLHSVKLQPITETSRVEFVNMVDLAQRQGRLPWNAHDEDTRALSISKYEVKITDPQKIQVYTRHTLHRIAGMIYFEDLFSKNIVALQMQSHDPSKFDFYMYESSSESDAKNICLTLAQAFETIQKRMMQSKSS